MVWGKNSELLDFYPPLAVLARSVRFPLQAFALPRFFAGFQLDDQICQENAPAAVSGVVVAIPFRGISGSSEHVSLPG
jgi:hypothetical protein